jgi:hypothetical protein
VIDRLGRSKAKEPEALVTGNPAKVGDVYGDREKIVRVRQVYLPVEMKSTNSVMNSRGEVLIVFKVKQGGTRSGEISRISANSHSPIQTPILNRFSDV